MTKYSLLDYEPYQKAVEKHKQLLDKYKKCTIPDLELYKNNVEEANNKALEAEADNLISESIDKKVVAGLKRNADKAADEFKIIEREAEKLIHEKKVIEVGLKKLACDVEATELEAKKHIAAKVRQDHNELVKNAVKAAKELSNICYEDRMMRAQLQGMKVNVNLAIISVLDHGMENEPNGHLYRLTRELKQQGYEI